MQMSSKIIYVRQLQAEKNWFSAQQRCFICIKEADCCGLLLLMQGQQKVHQLKDEAAVAFPGTMKSMSESDDRIGAFRQGNRVLQLGAVSIYPGMVPGQQHRVRFPVFASSIRHHYDVCWAGGGSHVLHALSNKCVVVHPQKLLAGRQHCLPLSGIVCLQISADTLIKLAGMTLHSASGHSLQP